MAPAEPKVNAFLVAFLTIYHFQIAVKLFTWRIDNFHRQALKESLSFTGHTIRTGIYNGPTMTAVNPYDNVEYTVKFKIRMFETNKCAKFEYDIWPPNDRAELHLERNNFGIKWKPLCKLSDIQEMIIIVVFQLSWMIIIPSASTLMFHLLLVLLFFKGLQFLLWKNSRCYGLMIQQLKSLSIAMVMNSLYVLYIYFHMLLLSHVSGSQINNVSMVSGVQSYV